MFPDEHSRPARHALPMDNMEGGALVQCDFTAVIDWRGTGRADLSSV